MAIVLVDARYFGNYLRMAMIKNPAKRRDF